MDMSFVTEYSKQDLDFVYSLFQAAELEARTTERYLLVTLGGMYSYLSTKEIPARLSKMAWYAPALVTLFSAVRALGLLARQVDALNYLKLVEHQYPLAGNLHGWALRSSASPLPLLIVTATLFYVVLLVGTFAVARRMTRQASDPGIEDR